MTIKVAFKRLENGAGIDIPRYATDGSAGMDIRAAVFEPFEIRPGHRSKVPCGFSMAIPEGYEAQIRPRSGLAVKHGVTVLNAPGTIDSDFRGEVCVILVNHGTEAFRVENGDRVGQMIFSKVNKAELVLAPELEETERGYGGFGSSGVK